MAVLLALALALAPAALFAEVMIPIAPPPPVFERAGLPPGSRYVWLGGYHRWDGAHYVWTAGHYEHPPRPGMHWVTQRYVHHRGGYVFEEGHWR